MSTLDTDVLGEHLGIIKGALLVAGAPAEVMNSLQWIRDQFEVVGAADDTARQTTPREDGFTMSDNPPITPLENVPDKPGRKPWSQEARDAAAARMRARQAARKEQAERVA